MAKKLSHKLQRELLANIGSLLDAGLKQAEIARQLVAFGGPKEKELGKAILQALEEGRSFAEGFQGYCDDVVLQTLLATEATGEPIKGFASAAKVLDVQAQGTSKLMLALAMPVAGLIASFAVIASVARFLYPMFSELLPVHRWPWLTQLINDTGLWVWGNGLLMLGMLLGLIGGVIATLPVLTGELRTQLDELPIYKQYRTINASVLFQSAGNLTTANFQLSEALKRINENATPYMRWQIAKMQQNLHSGLNPYVALSCGLLTAKHENTLQLLGSGGELAKTLTHCGKIVTDESLQNISAISEIGGLAIKLIGMISLLIVISGTGMLMLIFTNPSALAL
ncbi:MAG: type II secretion system F family protein [Ferrimonas sp.]